MSRIHLHLSLRASLLGVALLSGPLAYLSYRQHQHFARYQHLSEQKAQAATNLRKQADWLRRHGWEKQYRWDLRRYHVPPAQLAEKAEIRAGWFDMQASTYRDATQQWFWEPLLPLPTIPNATVFSASTVAPPSPTPNGKDFNGKASRNR